MCAKRVDENQGVIVDDLRMAGCLVQPLSDAGRGIPDLLVGYAGKLYLLEVKTAEGYLTRPQKAWHRLWVNYPVFIVHDTFEALRAVGAIGERERDIGGVNGKSLLA